MNTSETAPKNVPDMRPKNLAPGIGVKAANTPARVSKHVTPMSKRSAGRSDRKTIGSIPSKSSSPNRRQLALPRGHCALDAHLAEDSGACERVDRVAGGGEDDALEWGPGEQLGGVF